MELHFFPYQLQFKFAAGTSRGVLNHKETWFLVVKQNEKVGIGEAGLLRGLSIDDRSDYEKKLEWLQHNINLPYPKLWKALHEFPSIQFGLEMAMKSLQSKTPFLLFPSDFTDNETPIPINGLVWMGDKHWMKKQIIQKIEDGFHCIKLKIGAIDFEEELDLLKFIRTHFSEKELEIRVDANGAFSVSEALQKLSKLSQFNIHSIEQPIAAKQWEAMANLCQQSPIPIALDEELIGVWDLNHKKELLKAIQPAYLIFKPSLIGGWQHTEQWIDLAKKQSIRWWVTSALESNVGLNAIAQWTFTKNNPLPQGLGTGGLYHNNISSPLHVEKGNLTYLPNNNWNNSLFV